MSRATAAGIPREAIAFHLEGLAAEGEPAREPSSGAGVQVAHAA